MGNAGAMLDAAYRLWYRSARDLAIRIVKDNWMQGPRPERIGVKSGATRKSLNGDVLQDGFTLHASGGGVYWEPLGGIGRKVIRAKMGKVLPMKLKGSSSVTFSKTAVVPAQDTRSFMRRGLTIEAAPLIMQMLEKDVVNVIEKAFEDRLIV